MFTTTNNVCLVSTGPETTRTKKLCNVAKISYDKITIMIFFFDIIIPILIDLEMILIFLCVW